MTTDTTLSEFERWALITAVRAARTGREAITEARAARRARRRIVTVAS